jgi:hypothetical protein
MAAALQPHILARGITLQTVDVDTDPALKARFDWDVPLLFCDELEICRHEFDLGAFDRWLETEPN